MSPADVEAAGEPDAPREEPPSTELPRESRRVFFALWPDDATRTRLARATKDAVRRSGGRPIAKDKLHITVAFLGGLTPAGLEIASALPPITVGPFALALDRIGAFGSSRTLWLAARSVPTPLLELERRLWDALEAKGFIREPRMYLPHMTLARRARPVDADIEPIEWQVGELALVESLPDGRNVHYEVLRTWAL
jgi:2'-5' RNA ligase